MDKVVIDIQANIRKQNRAMLRAAISGTPQELFDYCLHRVINKKVVRVSIVGSTLYDQEKAADLVGHWFERLSKIQEKFNANK